MLLTPSLLTPRFVVAVCGGARVPPGVGVGGVVDWVPMEDYRFIMEVRPP